MKRILLIIVVLLLALTFVPSQAVAQTDKYALIVSYNGHKDSRVWASTCARLLKDVLRDNGFANKNIIFLNRATKGDVIEAFNTLKEKEGADSTVVVGFFGHGSCAGIGLYESQIYHSEIRNLLSGLDSQKQLIIIDTCGSAGAILLGTDGITLNATNRIVLTSTMFENESSVFTGHLTDWCRAVLKWGLLEGKADFNGDGRVSIQEAGSVKGLVADGYGTEFFL